MTRDSVSPFRRRLVISNALDAGGRSIVDFTTDVIAVAVLGASAAQMGLLNAAGMVAFLVLAAPVGVLVDRVSSRVSLVSSSLVKAGLAALTAALILTNTLTFPILLSIAVVFGISSLVTETGQVAVVPRIETGRGISALAGSLQAWDNALGIVVPASAAVAISYLSGGWVLAGATLLLAAAALIARRIRPAPIPSEPPALRSRMASAPLLAQLRAGFGPFRSSSALRRVTASTSLLNAALAVISAVEMVYLLRVVGLPIPAVGASATAGAIGGTLGAMLSGRIVARFGLGLVVRSASVCLLVAAGLLLALLLPAPLSALVVILCAQSFVWGFAQVAKNVAVYSWFTTIVPADLIGRASGLQRTATMGVVPVASLVGGVVGAWNVVTALVLGVVFVLVAGVSIWPVKSEIDPHL